MATAGTPSLHHSFEGKRVLVTGGGQGIGHAIVAKFYNDGAQLFVIDKNAQLLQKLVEEFPKITTIHLDLLDWDRTKEAIEKLAPLDHLVNNAGIAGEQPLLELTSEKFDEVIGVNVKAVVCGSQAFVKGVIKHKTKGATIVNISSIADRVGMWGLGVYNASKGAVTTLTKSMALEFGEHGIRVNCVNPTFINTELVKQIDPFVIEKNAELQGRVILKERALATTDIADAVLFLSSPLSAMITGASMLVDAGTCAF